MDEITRRLTKEDMFNWLDKAECGVMLTVCIGDDIRCPSIYAGRNADGNFTFIDSDSTFAYTKQYILTHDNISIDAVEEDEFFECMKILTAIKERGCK